MFLKKQIFIFLISPFLLFSSDSYSKPSKNDSLLNIINNTANDSTKIKAYHQLYLENDSIYYAFKALDLSEKSKNKIGLSQALLDIGRYYYFDGKEDVGMSYLIKCVKIAEETKNNRVLVSAYRYLGFIYRPHDSYVAEDYYNKSLKIAKKIKDNNSAAYALSALGNIYEGIFEGPSTDNKKALQFYLKSLAIREKSGTLEEIASSLNETSRVYDLLGENEKALLLRIRGLVVAEKSGSKENVVYLCNVLGNDYSLRLHDFKKGLSYQLKAYNIGLTQKNNFEIMFDVTKGIAYSYYSLGDIKNSNAFYQKAIILNDSIRAKSRKYDYNLSGLKHDLEEQLVFGMNDLLREHEVVVFERCMC